MLVQFMLYITWRRIEIFHFTFSFMKVTIFSYRMININYSFLKTFGTGSEFYNDQVLVLNLDPNPTVTTEFGSKYSKNLIQFN